MSRYFVFSLLALSTVLCGCRTTSLKRGANLVGGGYSIDFIAPNDGIAYLVDGTRRKSPIILSRSMRRGELISWNRVVLLGGGATWELRPDSRLYFEYLDYLAP